MAGFTNPQAETILKHFLTVATWPPVTLLYGVLGTSASSPDETGDIADWTEPQTASAYARISMANADASWAFTTDVDKAYAKNSDQLEYNEATGTWGMITYLGLSASATRGVGPILMWGTMTVAKQIDSGDKAIFAVNGITISLS